MGLGFWLTGGSENLSGYPTVPGSWHRQRGDHAGGGWKSEAMVARYTEHLQVKLGASAILAAKQARL
jgi:hypothetical protein